MRISLATVFVGTWRSSMVYPGLFRRLVKDFALKIQTLILSLLGQMDASKLFIIALFDSSFLSLPEVNDILIISLSIQNPAGMPYYCFMTTLGSIVGCLLLYAVGRKGGEVLLKRKFAEHRILTVSHWYKKLGIFAVMIPSILPPPTPFKIFVLFAGAFRVSVAKFVLAITLGRGFRYFFEGFLAVKYGERAKDYMTENYPYVAVALAGGILIGFFIFYWVRRTQTSREGMKRSIL
jgi:membrane protein YqaA with SNARE-associated domain